MIKVLSPIVRTGLSLLVLVVTLVGLGTVARSCHNSHRAPMADEGSAAEHLDYWQNERLEKRLNDWQREHPEQAKKGE